MRPRMPPAMDVEERATMTWKAGKSEWLIIICLSMIALMVVRRQQKLQVADAKMTIGY